MRKRCEMSQQSCIYFLTFWNHYWIKLLSIIQLPPHLTENKYFESLQNMVNRFDNRFRYALEVRDSSWFNDKIYDFLKDNKITLVWSVRDELKTPYIVYI